MARPQTRSKYPTRQVLSFGGGIQSVAMCLLALRGTLPRPDHIVCADTGREARSTWDYLRDHIGPKLAEGGLVVEIAGHEFSTTDLHAINGDLQIPAHTTTGKLRNFCSHEWKKRVVERYLKTRGTMAADLWIGFTVDEESRVHKKADTGAWQRIYPLLALGLSRDDCTDIIRDAGLPLPHKSACYMCPNRSNGEWRLIRDNYPDQWQLALALDREIRDADERTPLWLHPSRTPLSDTAIERLDRHEKRQQCDTGFCFV